MQGLLVLLPAQAAAVRLSAQAETQRWRSMEALLALAAAAAAADRDSCGGGGTAQQLSESTRTRVLAAVIEALDACDDATLLPLLGCLRRATPPARRCPAAGGICMLLPAIGHGTARKDCPV